jgi:hypothetical protein
MVKVKKLKLVAKQPMRKVLIPLQVEISLTQKAGTHRLLALALMQRVVLVIIKMMVHN